MKHVLVALASVTALVSSPAWAHKSCGHVGQPACSDGWTADGAAAPSPGGSDGAAVPGTGGSDASGGVSGSTVPSGGDALPTDAGSVQGTSPTGTGSGQDSGLGAQDCSVLEEWVRQLCSADIAKSVSECDGFRAGEIGGVLPVAECTAGSGTSGSTATQEASATTSDGSASGSQDATTSATGSKDTAVPSDGSNGTVTATGSDVLNFDNPSDASQFAQGASFFTPNDLGTKQGYIDFAPGSRSFMVAPNATDPALQKYKPLSIKDGTLTLTAQRIDTSDPGLKAVINRAHSIQNDGKNITWAGGQVYLPNMTIKPGDSIEARLRAGPNAPGVNGAFWLFSKEGGNSPRSSNEIDIADLVGSPNTAYTHIHTGGDNYLEAVHPGNFSDWHTYKLDYNPGAITVSVDGKKLKTFTGGMANNFTGPMYPLLSNGGGDSYLNTPDSVKRVDLQVDYIKKTTGGAKTGS